VPPPAPGGTVVVLDPQAAAIEAISNRPQVVSSLRCTGL